MDVAPERDASSLVLSKALNGDLESQFELACALEAENQANVAIGWYKKAAQSGHKEAAYRGALLLLKGDRVAQGEAQYWLGHAAALGHHGAEYQIALCCERGQGTKLDPDEALRWFRTAASHGNAEAKERLDSLNRFLDDSPPRKY